MQSLSRGLRVLSAVLSAPGSVTLTELAVATGIHKATALRFVRTLVEDGYVSVDLRGPRYSAGPVFIGHALRGRPAALTQAAGPALAEIARVCRETIALYLPAWPDVVCCAVVPSPEPIRRHREVGDRQPMTRSSVGRAFLSQVPADFLDSTLRARPLQAFTPHTITDPEEFRAALLRARRQGYATSFEELNSDMGGLAVPLAVGDSTVPVAVVSVSGPRYRWGPDEVEAFAPTLVQVCARLSRELSRLGAGDSPRSRRGPGGSEAVRNATPGVHGGRPGAPLGAVPSR